MPGSESNIYLYSRPRGSGKTTSLEKWAGDRRDVNGILSPVIGGLRYFRDIRSGETFPMEAVENEDEVWEVGRFRFSRSAFEKAIQLLRAAIQAPGWLVIDEIGPLEMRGAGFHDILKELLELQRSPMLLVLREGLEAEWKEVFKNEARLIRDITELYN